MRSAWSTIRGATIRAVNDPQLKEFICHQIRDKAIEFTGQTALNTTSELSKVFATACNAQSQMQKEVTNFSDQVFSSFKNPGNTSNINYRQ